MPQHIRLESSAIEPWKNESSAIGWKTQGILPEEHSSNDFVDVVIDDSTREFVLPSPNGIDLTTCVKGALQAKSVRCQHHNVYVEGDVGEHSKIEGRDGIISARSLQPGADITRCSLIVLENFGLSEKSRNFSTPLPPDACIILVDPDKREEVFCRVTGMNREIPSRQREITILAKDKRNLMQILKQLNDDNLLKGVQGIRATDLKAAGIEVAAIAR